MVINNKFMKIWLVFLFILGGLSNVLAQDTDSDGVSNTSDLCPNTPTGTVVNAYGCPTTLSTCDYTTNNFSLNIVGTAPVETRYILANSATGQIEQISTSPTFTGLTGTKTYMVLAYSYTSSPTGLTVGNQLSAVSAVCQDFSNSLMVKVCVAQTLPTISINDVTVSEDGVNAILTVTLSAAQTTPVTVDFTTNNSSALIGSDYTNQPGTITFAAGETTRMITIPIIDDAINEPTEIFFVDLSSPVGATIADNQGIVTITDNDQGDTDNDGVPDVNDLCPNTPVGTVVNSYGCPTTLSTCDYNTSNVTFNLSTPAPIGKQTRYILADATDGKIVQISLTPAFTGLVGSKTYMVLAYSYEDNGTLVNLTVNNFLNQVSATCADWSNALVVKICSPFIDNGTCDYTTSTITLKTQAAAPAGATTKYVLVNSAGNIAFISNTTTFTGLSGSNVYNAYAISYIGTINNLSVGSSFSSVNGTCFDWSSPLSIKVCVCKQDICVPITITKTRRI